MNEATSSRFTGEEARRLIRGARSGTLSTLLADGSPYGSLVNVASDQRGRPLMLLSRLAWHTRNLQSDSRASLLVVGEGSFADPLEGPRAALMGRCTQVEEGALPEARRRFLARHPSASLYAGFQDFGWWRLEIGEAHAVAGFGRIETIPGADTLLGEADGAALTEIEPNAVQHMNEDHLEAVSLYATRLLGAPEGAWRMAAVDADGADLSDGERSLRLPFDRTVRGADELRKMLVALAGRARNTEKA